MRITRFLTVFAFLVAGFACTDRSVGDRSLDLNGDGIPDNCAAYTGGHHDDDNDTDVPCECRVAYTGGHHDRDDQDECDQDNDDDTDTDGPQVPNIP